MCIVVNVNQFIMAMNKYMHPRNPYKKAPDFLQLTLDYPDLRQYVKPDLSGKIKMNFKREGAVRELTKCLLHKDFGLTIDLPSNRLVPTLPLRMNYLLWVEDLLNESGKQFHGIDIGTGASCIYPLLAAKHFNWKMTATEIDIESTAYATNNVEKNGLKELIEVKKVDSSIMLVGALKDNVTYDFCMCNPPFYCDESDMTAKARTDRRPPPRNHPSGQDFELIAPGGEIGFISRIVEDSVKLCCNVRVYTVMLGHKSSLNKVKDMVKKINPVKMRTTEFCQGRTTRWGLAWTFSHETNLISTAIQPRKEQSKPPYRWVYPGQCNIEAIKSQVIEILNNLQMEVEEIENDEGNCGLCLKAYENTWTNSRRKRREEKRKQVDKQVVSPCDSVVTANDSVDSGNSNDPLSPCSLPDSIGYVSDSDQRPSSTDLQVKHIEVNSSLPSCEDTPTNCSESKETKTILEDPCPSAQLNTNISVQDSSEELESPVSPAKLKLEENLPKSNVSSGKRKIPSTAEPGSVKRMKRSDRPLLQAVLVLSEFDNDLILSLSFIDGTGGRESANQVFQYLKNKIS